MPIYDRAEGYDIFTFMESNGEPAHVHIANKSNHANYSKLWFTSNHEFVIAHNHARIPNNKLKKIIDKLNQDPEEFIEHWIDATHHESITYYR
jgi:hypothetical protein